MNTLVLHGELAEKFGPSFKLDVRSPSEAVRAVCAQIPAFQEMIRKGNFYMYRKGPAGGRFNIDETNLGVGMSNNEIHLLPEAEGSASGKGVGKLLVGIALIALVAWNPAGWALGATVFGSSGITFGAAMTGLGIGLVLGGAAMLLSPQPKLNTGTSDQDSNNSILFSGSFGSSGQNIPVPLCYGRMRVPGIPVATAIETNQVYIAAGQTYNNPWDGQSGSQPT